MSISLPEKKVHPIRNLGEIILRKTEGLPIIIDPKITPEDPLGGYEDIEFGPYPGLLLANFGLYCLPEKVPVGCKQLRWGQSLSRFELYYDASLVATTYHFGVEAMTEAIAREYAQLTGREIETYVRFPFGPPIQTEPIHEMPELGATLYELLQAVRIMGVREAHTRLEEVLREQDRLRTFFGLPQINHKDQIRLIVGAITPPWKNRAIDKTAQIKLLLGEHQEE